MNNKYMNNKCGIKHIIPQNNIHKIKIATWNLYGATQFAKLSLIKRRIKYIINIIKKEDLDIICLQEVSQYILDKLLSLKWIKDNFYTTTYKKPWSYKDNTEPNCFPVTLSKYPILRQNYIIHKSHEDIEFSSVITDLGFINIANVHLQSSLHNHKCRKEQMIELKKYIKEKYDINNVIITGDFNCDLNIENHKLFPESTSIKRYMTDSWTYTGNSGIDGTTENTYKNTMRYNIKGIHKDYRYDGILYKSNRYRATKSYLFGNKKIFDISTTTFFKIADKEPCVINKNNRIDWFSSDHFGVICYFESIQ